MTTELADEAFCSERQAFAVRLAESAGHRARQWFRRPLEVARKHDASPVTAADREIELFVRSEIEAHFPEDGVIGEEFGAERSDAEFVWIVDPIDGTRSFITGWPIWGTLLAMLRHGVPEIGIVEMPVLGERWVGAAGGDTVMTSDGAGRLCRTRPCSDLSEAVFYTTSLLYFEGDDRSAIETIAEAAATARFGGDCYGYGLLAAGFVDLVVETRLQPYDYLPLVPVIEGAGGVITDWQGGPLSLSSDGRVIAAATRELHAQTLALLPR